MGKGFNNYMCKKFFHPASRDNLKRVWMAEQKSEAYKQKQEELRVQYEKEQDVFNNKALVSKESKEKLSVNFMYEPPPGMKKDHVKEEGEPEFKFEWQRKYNAPRESYCKGDQEINDQPFGIPVRNVRCLKCRKWGHLNTDRECPLFASFSGVEAGSTGNDTFSLMRQMREDGLQMKRSAVNTLDSQPIELEPEGPSEQTSDPEDISEQMEIVKSMSVRQKKKLLKKIKKLEKEKKRMKKERLSQSNKSSRGHHRHDSDSDEEVVIKKEMRSPTSDDREQSKMYNRRERRHNRSLSRDSMSDSGDELVSRRGQRSGYERSNGTENKTHWGGGSSKKDKGDRRRDASVEKEARINQRGESGKSRRVEDREMRGDRRRNSQDRRRADSDSENETRNGYEEKHTKSDKKQSRRERSGSRDRKHKRKTSSDFDDERATRRSPKREHETETSRTSNGKERRRDRCESEGMRSERKTKSPRDDGVVIKKENITPDREVREKIRGSHDKEKRNRSKSRDKSNKSEKREDRREERKRRHSDSD